jgi:hypothetical protein
MAVRCDVVGSLEQVDVGIRPGRPEGHAEAGERVGREHLCLA